MVEPMLEPVVAFSQRDKDSTGIYHFIFFLTLLEPAEHGFRECPDEKGEYLLKGNHDYNK